MKLLIITQKVDKNDGVLGFFHNWIIEFAKKCEKLTVICLYKGEYDLPKNVKVLSLGKENGQNKFKYIYNFYKYVWKYRKDYDSVFVHMNQEYIFLGFFIWRILRKRFFLWRNHFYGNFLTDLACFLCSVTFCTSKFSYINKFKKNVLMPVGIDTEYFIKKEEVNKSDNILFLARISPSKKLEQLVEAMKILKDEGLNLYLTVVGDSPPVYKDYYKSILNKIKKYNLEKNIKFVGEIPNYRTVDFYNQSKLSINLTLSGSFDKTIFEAMACETLVLVCNRSLVNEIPEQYIFQENNINDLSEKIIKIFNTPADRLFEDVKFFRNYTVKNHSLELLVRKLLNFF